MTEYASITVVYLCAVLSQITAGRVANLRRYDRTENAVTVETELQCSHQMARVYNDDVIAPFPPNLVGEWTSMRCEVRPGPEFLLRKYRFHDNQRFSAIQYYYEDSHCKRPMYTLLATGSYYALQPSWLLTGATEMEYQLNHVRVKPASDRLARLLANKVNATCPSLLAADWRKGEWRELFSYVELPDEDYPDEDAVLLEDTDCLSAISFSMHELQLLRIEIRKKHHGTEKRLLLGDIHTEPAERRTYRPTGFQEPLLYMDQTDTCPVCMAIMAADEYHAPLLRTNHHHHHHRDDDADELWPRLTGSWASTECETRPGGVFVTRQLTFDDDRLTWRGRYRHFLDGRCRRPQFTASVGGKYARGGPSPAVGGAVRIDFQVLEARIAAEDEAVVRSLNAVRPPDRCGGGADGGPWLVGVERDVTAGGGCPALGVRLPHTEYELVRVERRRRADLLYLGQRPTVGDIASPRDRPTSFQSPLVKCRDDDVMTTTVAPPLRAGVMTAAKRRLGGAASTPCLHWSLFLVSISLAATTTLIK